MLDVILYTTLFIFNTALKTRPLTSTITWPIIFRHVFGHV